MPIDWFTVIAQVVNFLLLVVLLRIFLYRPILDAMDRREEKITSRLEEAENKHQEAEKQRQELEEQRREFEDNKNELLEEAKEDAEKQRKQLIKEAREKADEAKDKWLNQVEEERDSFLQNLRQQIGRETCSLARKALADLADANLQEQMTHRFLDRLDKDSIKDADEENGVVVRSSFDLIDSVRDEVRKTLKDLLGGDDEPGFETDDDLLCGIELRIGDQKISWSIEYYLDDFEERLEKAIKE